MQWPLNVIPWVDLGAMGQNLDVSGVPLCLEWFQPSITLMLYQEVFQAQSCIFSLGFKVAFLVLFSN